MYCALGYTSKPNDVCVTKAGSGTNVPAGVPPDIASHPIVPAVGGQTGAMVRVFTEHSTGPAGRNFYEKMLPTTSPREQTSRMFTDLSSVVGLLVRGSLPSPW